MTWKPRSGFDFVYQPSYYQIWIEVKICQTESIMTLNCELCQSEFSVLSGRLIIKLLKICFLCTNVGSMIIQQRFNALLQIHYKTVLLFFPLLSKFFTNILKIYELPKIYNKKILGKIFFKKCSVKRVLYLLHQILSLFSTIM